MLSSGQLAWYAVLIINISSSQLCQLCLRGIQPNVVDDLL